MLITALWLLGWMMAIVGANNTTNITIGPISTYIPFEDWGGGVGGGGGGHGGGEMSDSPLLFLSLHVPSDWVDVESVAAIVESVHQDFSLEATLDSITDVTTHTFPNHFIH